MSESSKKQSGVVQRTVRKEWRRPEVNRVRAGAAELTLADYGTDIAFS